MISGAGFFVGVNIKKKAREIFHLRAIYRLLCLLLYASFTGSVEEIN